MAALQAMRKECLAQLTPSTSSQQPGSGPDEGVRLSAARKGYLRCLLQMGHMEAVMGQVDGWSLSCSGQSCNAQRFLHQFVCILSFVSDQAACC